MLNRHTSCIFAEPLSRSCTSLTKGWLVWLQLAVVGRDYVVVRPNVAGSPFPALLSILDHAAPCQKLWWSRRNKSTVTGFFLLSSGWSEGLWSGHLYLYSVWIQLVLGWSLLQVWSASFLISLTVVSYLHARLVQWSCSCHIGVSHLFLVFFGIGMNTNRIHSSGHHPLCQTSVHISCSLFYVTSPPNVSNSTAMLCGSGAFRWAAFSMACLISFIGGGSLSWTSMCTFSCFSLCSSSQYSFQPWLTFPSSVSF